MPYTTKGFLLGVFAHHSSVDTCMPIKIMFVCIGLQPLYKRQALTHSPQSRSKPFKKEVRHTSPAKSTRHRHLHNSTKTWLQSMRLSTLGPRLSKSTTNPSRNSTPSTSAKTARAGTMLKKIKKNLTCNVCSAASCRLRLRNHWST